MTERNIEFSLMAGAAYESTRGQFNQIPYPEGWITLSPTTGLDHRQDDITGFEAAAFTRTNGSQQEIVISFAGDDIEGDAHSTNIAPTWSVTRTITTDAGSTTIYYTTYNQFVMSAPSIGGDDAPFGEGPHFPHWARILGSRPIALCL